MKKSKILTIAGPLALAAGALISTPAAATQGNDATQLRAQISQLERQVERAESRGTLSRNMARNLDRRVDRLQSLYRDYSRNGFNRGEVRTLGKQIDSVKKSVDQATQDNGRRNRR